MMLEEKSKLNGNVQTCIELYMKIQKYFEYPTKRLIQKHEQLCWMTYLNLYKQVKVFAVDLYVLVAMFGPG